MIVTAQELATHMSDVEFGADQERSAEIIIEGVQGMLEDWLKRPVEVRTFENEIVQGDDSGAFYPKGTPIVSITSIGYEVDEDTVQEIPTGSYRKRKNFVDFGGGYGGFGWYETLVMTYTGGLDGASIPSIRNKVLDLAARYMTFRHDDTMSVKGLDTRNTGDVPAERILDFDPDEEFKTLYRYKRRTVAT